MKKEYIAPEFSIFLSDTILPFLQSSITRTDGDDNEWGDARRRNESSDDSYRFSSERQRGSGSGKGWGSLW